MMFQKQRFDVPSRNGIFATWLCNIPNQQQQLGPNTYLHSKYQVTNDATNNNNNKISVSLQRQISSASSSSTTSNSVRINNRIKKQIYPRSTKQQPHLSASLSSLNYSNSQLSRYNNQQIDEIENNSARNYLNNKNRLLSNNNNQVLHQKILTFPGSNLIKDHTQLFHNEVNQVPALLQHKNSSEIKSRPRRISSYSNMGNLQRTSSSLSSASSSSSSLASSSCTTTPQDSSQKSKYTDQNKVLQTPSNVTENGSSTIKLNNYPSNFSNRRLPNLRSSVLDSNDNDITRKNQVTASFNTDCLSIRQLNTNNSYNNNSNNNNSTGFIGCFPSSNMTMGSCINTSTRFSKSQFHANMLEKKLDYFPYPDPSLKASRTFMTRLSEISVLTQNTIRQERSKNKKNSVNNTSQSPFNNKPQFRA